MGLDYKYTCPDIDNSINKFKDDISNYLSDMIDDCSPMLKGKQKDIFIKSYTRYIYKSLETNFEFVRLLNKDLREEANIQINNMKSELEKRDVIIAEYELQTK